MYILIIISNNIGFFCIFLHINIRANKAHMICKCFNRRGQYNIMYNMFATNYIYTEINNNNIGTLKRGKLLIL